MKVLIDLLFDTESAFMFSKILQNPGICANP
jgi:hypothetical protein